jgi:ATP-binding cassette subfamily C (CFTR/MRP) protein 10
LVVDIATVDDSLPFIVNIALAQIFGLLGIVVVLFVSVGREAPFLIIAFLLLGFWYRSTQRQYIACSREVKRLEASRRTPLHSLVLDVSAEGLEHIRAYRREEFFSRKFDGALEAYIQTLFVSTGLASWLALRLQMMAAFVGLVIVALGSPDQLPTSNSMEGIAIAYIIPITGLLGGLVSSLSEVERQMVSVERLFELFRRGPEAEEEGGSTQSQVSSGSLVLSHVHYHYPGLDDYAIRDISFELVEGSRTVVVGRSGCGKSTLLCTILGLLPVSCGDILFGGIRQSKISRGELQALIGYLPQTPVLFEASVRENLDPKRHHCDDELQFALQVTCLEHLHLDDVIMPSALTAASRVFFSLARLVLLRPRYLLLDEPSSALNASEMTALFAVMNSTFSAEVTILETSHALERALEADMVVVLEKGAVLELGRPDDLLSRSYSEFASMLLANDSTHPLVTS